MSEAHAAAHHAAAAGGTPCFAHSLRGRHPLILNFRTDFQFRCFFCQTVMSFLRQFNLHNDFKLNIEPNHTTLAGHGYEHDVVMAST